MENNVIVETYYACGPCCQINLSFLPTAITKTRQAN